MKTNDVLIGEVYEVKVGNRSTDVRIDKTISSGGWEGVSEKSGKTIRIKSAGRLKRKRKPRKKKVSVETVIPVEAEPMIAQVEHGHVEDTIQDALLGCDSRSMSLDEIVTATGLPIGNVSAALMVMEIKRTVRQHPGKVFSIVAEAGKKKAPIAKKSEVKNKDEPHAFCCGCGNQLENRMKWYCGDECKSMAKKSGIRYCWHCGQKVEKGMTCETC